MIVALFACTPPKEPADTRADTGTSGVTGDTGPAGHTGGELVPHSAVAHSAIGHTGATGHTAVAPTYPEPDFHLVDLNPTSPTFNATMSPRDELTKVSGWYFTHAS